MKEKIFLIVQLIAFFSITAFGVFICFSNYGDPFKRIATGIAFIVFSGIFIYVAINDYFFFRRLLNDNGS